MDKLKKHLDKYKYHILLIALALYAVWRLISAFPLSLFSSDNNNLSAPTGNSTSKKQTVETKKQALETVITKNPPQVSKLSRNDAYYKAVAEQLYTLLNSYVYGISDNKILNVLYGKPIHNPSEIKVIAKHFGVRKATFFGVPVGDPCTLHEALKSKLSRFSQDSVDFIFKYTDLDKNAIRY